MQVRLGGTVFRLMGQRWFTPQDETVSSTYTTALSTVVSRKGSQTVLIIQTDQIIPLTELGSGLTDQGTVLWTYGACAPMELILNA